MTLAGLRPGEKLFEEKLMAEEGLKKTRNELIHIGCPIPFDIEEFLGELDELMVFMSEEQRMRHNSTKRYTPRKGAVPRIRYVSEIGKY